LRVVIEKLSDLGFAGPVGAFIPEQLLRSIVIYCAFDTSKIDFSGEAFKTPVDVGDGL
jgi:hypothetical protein